MTNSSGTVVSIQKDVSDMTPGEVLDYLAFLRRGIHKRRAEREAADQSTLAPEAIANLTQVALSDASELANLDRLEAMILADLGRVSH